MPPKDDELELLTDAKEGKVDELRLELHKEEKEARPPPALWKIVLILTSIILVLVALAIGLAKVISNADDSGLRDFADWIVIMVLILLGGVVFSGSIIGFWGGQRNIPIRMISPSDASVVGTGAFLSGYVIEDCIDNEIELTIQGKDKEIIHEELVAIDEKGLFYSELRDVFAEIKKSQNVFIEAWMVSAKSAEIKLVVRAKKLDDMNVKRTGLKIGALHFFPAIYKDFSDKSKILFDPKRKEKGYIERVKLESGRTTNIFFPDKNDDDKFVPFSFEKVADMRQNALYFDIKRKRRGFYSLMFFLIAALLAIYPIVEAIIS
ncbi:MAG: hypothetical protein FK732_05060 [Asgard group archaeon]|nr:hypothetical protein [Asgard group archaeon]